MGRPNQCNVCCGGVDPPEPPDIGDCERVICITFMDENSSGRSSFEQKYNFFKAAYPERLLFVLDVENRNNQYPQNFIDSDTAYSLRDEHTKDPNITNGLRYIKRENPVGGGDTTTANYNDAWGRIKSIVNYYGGDILAKFNAATEFSVFRDDSGSMRATQVEATYNKLVADALVDGKLEARAIVNRNEDTVCPFVQEQCCTNSSSTALMTLCGITSDCDPKALNFTQQPQDALIREYCDNIQFFPPGQGFDTVCGTCLNEQQEDDKQSTEFTAVATNGAGEGLNVDLMFSLQASDDLENWSTIENLPDGGSGDEQSLSALLDNWGGSSLDPNDCHQWLSDGGEYGGEWGQLGSDIDGEESGDQSGFSVSLNAAGDRVAIGAPFNDGNGQDSGHTRIFQWNGVSWTQLGSDIDGEAANDRSGHSVSLNSAGDRVAIGARRNDGSNGIYSGHTRVFEWNGVSWTQLGSDIDGEASGDQSGFSVSLNSAGDRLAIGAPNNDGSGSQAGHTRVFQWNGVSWAQLGSDIDGEAAGDINGYSVSLNAAGDRVAIGGPYNDDNGFQSGHTRIFQWNGVSWTQLGSDIDGEKRIDRSGFSVSLNSAGNRVAIGAPYNDGSNGIYSGHTRVFEWNGSSWTQIGSDIDGEAVGDRSGLSVSLNAAGDRVAIGARKNDGNGNVSGHTRVFQWNGVSWTQIGSDIDGEADGDESGLSVSLNSAGDRVAIGAPLNDEVATSAGSTRIFNIETTPAGAFDQYQETIIGSCRKRVWSRRFRIKAQTDNGLVAYSDPFQIYQWYGPNDVDPPSPDGGRWLGGSEIVAGYAGSFLRDSNYSIINFGSFCDAKGINYEPQSSSSPPLLTGFLWNYRTGPLKPNSNFSKGLVWIFDGLDGRTNTSWNQLSGYGEEDDGYATESSIWGSEFQRGTIVDVAGNRNPLTNQIVAVQAGESLPRVELFNKRSNLANEPKLDTVDHISQIENVGDGIAGSDSFSLVASPFVLKTDPDLNNVLSEKLHIFAHVIKGTNKLQFYAQSPNTKKFIRVQLETGFDDWPLLFDRGNGDTLGNISIHARPIVIQNGDGTYGGHTSVHVAYSIKQNNVSKMFVQRWRLQYLSGGLGPVDEAFVIFREEDPEIPDSTEIADSVNQYDNREFITTSYSLNPVVVKFSKEWSQSAILVAFGLSGGNPDGDNINVYRWDNQSGLGIQNYRLGNWTKRQEITGRSIVEQFEPSLDPTYKWQFPIRANKLAMTDLSMGGNVIAFPYLDFNSYPINVTGSSSPLGDPVVVMEWNGSEYIKKGNILRDFGTQIVNDPEYGRYLTSNYSGLSLNNNGQAIILATRLDHRTPIGTTVQDLTNNALSIYRWLPE